jgi:uncharacterized protein (TIGR00106 family)
VIPLADDPIPIVHKAIEVVQKSGVKHLVCPHETVMEGDLDKLVEIVKAGHRACFEAGAKRVVTVVKLVENIDGATIDSLIDRYRK